MSKRTRAGYTAVEVLISMTLLSIGAAGVVSMQRGAILGNVEARRLDTANSVAHLWLDRLQSDSMMWTLPNRNNLTDNRISKAKLLATVDGAWHLPTAYDDATPPMSPAADVLGHDLPTTAWSSDPSAGYFCTNVRLTWLVPDQLMRAEVRVYWPRGLVATNKFNVDCVDPPPNAITTSTQQYHFVYATTAIRQNQFFER